MLFVANNKHHIDVVQYPTPGRSAHVLSRFQFIVIWPLTLNVPKYARSFQRANSRALKSFLISYLSHVPPSRKKRWLCGWRNPTTRVADNLSKGSQPAIAQIVVSPPPIKAVQMGDPEIYVRPSLQVSPRRDGSSSPFRTCKDQSRISKEERNVVLSPALGWMKPTFASTISDWKFGLIAHSSKTHSRPDQLRIRTPLESLVALIETFTSLFQVWVDRGIYTSMCESNYNGNLRKGKPESFYQMWTNYCYWYPQLNLVNAEAIHSSQRLSNELPPPFKHGFLLDGSYNNMMAAMDSLMKVYDDGKFSHAFFFKHGSSCSTTVCTCGTWDRSPPTRPTV